MVSRNGRSFHLPMPRIVGALKWEFFPFVNQCSIKISEHASALKFITLQRREIVIRHDLCVPEAVHAILSCIFPAILDDFRRFRLCCRWVRWRISLKHFLGEGGLSFDNFKIIGQDIPRRHMQRPRLQPPYMVSAWTTRQATSRLQMVMAISFSIQQ